MAGFNPLAAWWFPGEKKKQKAKNTPTTTTTRPTSTALPPQPTGAGTPTRIAPITPSGGSNYSALTPTGMDMGGVAATVTRDEFWAQVTGLPVNLGAAPVTLGNVSFDIPAAGLRGEPLHQTGYQRDRQGPTAPLSSHDAMGQLMNMPEAEIMKWKNAVYDAGLYDSSYYSKGIKPRQNGLLESGDLNAFQELMYISTRAPAGTTIQGVLEKMRSDNPFSAANNYGKGQREGRTQTVSVSDPATIRKYARAAAQELLGRDLDDATLGRLVGVMQGAEKSVGVADANRVNAAYESASATGQDQTVVTTNVDVGSRTEEQIMAENPEEVEAKKFANGFDVFMRLMTGGA